MLFKYALNAKTSELYVGTTPSVVLVGQIGMSLFSNSIIEFDYLVIGERRDTKITLIQHR